MPASSDNIPCSSPEPVISSPTSPSIVPPTDWDLKRQTVVTYCEQQKKNGNPIDLIIGRGKKEPHSNYYPTLIEKRNFQEKGMANYNPLLIDIDGSVEPDLVADITDPQSMSYFDDQSFDEIYLERIFPTGPLVNPKTYCTAARILKPNGLLLVDISSLCPIQEKENSMNIINDFLTHYEIPLFYQPNSKQSRNNLEGNTMVFVRLEVDFDPNLLLKDKKRLERATQELAKAHKQPLHIHLPSSPLR